MTKLDPRETAVGIQKAHDALENEASHLYNMVKSEAKNRGINSIPVNPVEIEKFKDYLPKTREYQSLVDRAKSGDYDSIHKLQSDIWKEAKERSMSKAYAERHSGKELFEKREDLNDLIHKHFEDTGHKDLSQELEKGRGLWKNLKETYYSHPQIAKMVERESRKIPKNPLALFSEDSEKMRKLIKAHPEIKKDLDLASEKKKLFGALKNAGYTGIVGAGITGTVGTYKMLKNILSGPPGESGSENYNESGE